ncbi:hypothetical protein GC174_08530 [bacterium]|nr:hypothetical protein [bacterium]
MSPSHKSNKSNGDDLFSTMKKVVAILLPSNLTKITDTVSSQLGDARQKLLSADSSIKSVARFCIDDAEDAYQEAIYALKDGYSEEAMRCCKKAISYLKVANFHLKTNQELLTEPAFKAGSCEDAIQKLARSIAQFKSVIEYTNCELDRDEHERYMEVVRIFYRSLDDLAGGKEEIASKNSLAGLTWLYILSRFVEVRSGASMTVAAGVYLREHGPLDIQRILDLADSLVEARRLHLDSSAPTKARTEQYLVAATRTLNQCVSDFLEGSPVEKMVRAGKMEVRMANRLIESGFSGDGEPQAVPGESESESGSDVERRISERQYEFSQRIAHLQQLIKDNDPDGLRIVRRLHQVSSYYGRALRLQEEGNSSEAERYARSAHLDIDFARQLFTRGDAIFSDTI